MKTNTQYWLQLWGLLAFAFGSVSGSIIIIKKRLKEQLGTKSFGNGWKRTFLVLTGDKVKQPVSKLIILVLGILIGYTYRDARLLSRMDTITRVIVIHKYDDHNYQLAFRKTGQSFNARFCKDSPIPSLEPGDEFESIHYEQLPDCMNIRGKNLGFYR